MVNSYHLLGERGSRVTLVKKPWNYAVFKVSAGGGGPAGRAVAFTRRLHYIRDARPCKGVFAPA